MIGEVLVSLLAEAYDKWLDGNLSVEAYKCLAEIVMAKADELVASNAIAPEEWDAVEGEFSANQLLVDDVP